jgi:peptidoglycan/xylan/chitin deacetylase (PgdA/CDA1 family)
MDPAAERAAIQATMDRIEAASGTRPVGWLGSGLAETWNTLDYFAEAGICYVCDWINDDQPYMFEICTPPLVSLPYSVQTNDGGCPRRLSRYAQGEKSSHLTFCPNPFGFLPWRALLPAYFL